MDIENIFPHTLAKQLSFFLVIKMNRRRASIIRKVYCKSSKDVSGTLLRGIKPSFVKTCFRSLY